MHLIRRRKISALCCLVVVSSRWVDSSRVRGAALRNPNRRRRLSPKISLSVADHLCALEFNWRKTGCGCFVSRILGASGFSTCSTFVKAECGSRRRRRCANYPVPRGLCLARGVKLMSPDLIVRRVLTRFSRIFVLVALARLADLLFLHSTNSGSSAPGLLYRRLPNRDNNRKVSF